MVITLPERRRPGRYGRCRCSRPTRGARERGKPGRHLGPLRQHYPLRNGAIPAARNGIRAYLHVRKTHASPDSRTPPRPGRRPHSSNIGFHHDNAARQDAHATAAARARKCLCTPRPPPLVVVLLPLPDLWQLPVRPREVPRHGNRRPPRQLRAPGAHHGGPDLRRPGVSPQPYGSAARAYLEAGYSPLPLPPRKKASPPEGYTGRNGRRVDPADVDRWIAENRSGNIGLRLPAGVVGHRRGRLQGRRPHGGLGGADRAVRASP